jgi:hypothetical protein
MTDDKHNVDDPELADALGLTFETSANPYGAVQPAEPAKPIPPQKLRGITQTQRQRAKRACLAAEGSHDNWRQYVLAPNAPAPAVAHRARVMQMDEAIRIGLARRVGITPLEFLLSCLRDPGVRFAYKLDAAKAAAPYMHKRQPIAIQTSGPEGQIDLSAAALHRLSREELLHLRSLLMKAGVGEPAFVGPDPSTFAAYPTPGTIRTQNSEPLNKEPLNKEPIASTATVEPPLSTPVSTDQFEIAQRQLAEAYKSGNASDPRIPLQLPSTYTPPESDHDQTDDAEIPNPPDDQTEIGTEPEIPGVPTVLGGATGNPRRRKPRLFEDGYEEPPDPDTRSARRTRKIRLIKADLGTPHAGTNSAKSGVKRTKRRPAGSAKQQKGIGKSAGDGGPRTGVAPGKGKVLRVRKKNKA